MAYAALVSLEKTIDKIQHDHNYDQYSISPHDRQKFISIHKYITFLRAFLEDFPDKASSLEGRVKNVANEAEDIIEYFMSEQIRLCHILHSTTGPESVKFPHHLTGLFTWFQGKRSGVYTKLRLHFNFKELKKVAREVVGIKNSTRTEDVQLGNSSVATSTSRRIAPTNKDAMVGFEDDLMAIKGRLCGESFKLEVIPIFGMGVIGKTTLSRNAYDDPLILEHFQIRAWVTVSQDYSVQGILSSLLVAIKAFTNVEPEQRKKSRKESMEELVYKSLKGRRYLIVMDDMWSIKAWDDIKIILPDDHNGSRIMLTTRLFNVAAYPDSSSPLHEMRFLDADQSWYLLQQRMHPQENYPRELETIGKTIARSCRGLPLAIIVTAGLLFTVSKTQTSWKNVAENINLAISTTNDKQFPKILSLSYNNLPHHLRPCFLYMGAFPEDYEIRVSELIKLWVAEGFLKSSGSKSLEEVDAEEYLENLVKRSLVMVTKRKSNGKIKSCSIHDLVRDLCIRKAEEEKFHLHVMNRYRWSVLLEKIKNHHRLSVTSFDLILLKDMYASTNIRTVLCFQYYNGISLRSFGTFRLLRVLNVVPETTFEFFRIVVLPDEIFELFHLRYLALTFMKEEFVVPPSILNLQNLQTLILQQEVGYLLVHLPLEIWRMRQLRHLKFIGPLPEILEGAATFPLENLQTLWGVKSFKCSEEILKMFPNLKRLGIIYSGKEYVEDNHLENLVYLHQLEKLKLEVQLPFRCEKLNPILPMMLKELTLSGQIFPWKEMSIVGWLPTLQVLKLRNNACFGNKWEEFRKLEFLLIDESYLEQWVTESSHFPSLKSLVLYYCWGLKEIPDGIGDISTLELIEVDGWNEPVLDSAKRIQEEQQENCGNYAIQVRIQPRRSK